MKKTAGLLVLLWAVWPAGAQSHLNTWFRSAFDYKLNSRLTAGADVQHRRQNGWGNHNPLDKNLLYSVRPWLHYRPARHVKCSVSPFAYFYNYRPIRTLPDAGAAPLREIRFTAAAEGFFKWSAVGFYDRAGIEYRIIQYRAQNIVRVRNRSGIRYPINAQLDTDVYAEWLFNLNGVDAGHFFDHSRCAALLVWTPAKNLRIESGYLYVVRLPLNVAGRMYEHNLVLNFHVTLN